MQTQTTPAGELQLITIGELAERLRIHPDTLRGLYRRGKYRVSSRPSYIAFRLCPSPRGIAKGRRPGNSGDR